MLQPVGLAVHGNYVYWIDSESRNVMKMKEDELYGSTVQAAIDDLSDIIVVDTLKTTGKITKYILLIYPFKKQCSKNTHV